MKKLYSPVRFIPLIMLFLTACHYHSPGPPGQDGQAFFGISYEYQPPYSYWDNNPDIPSNPVLDQYYHTYPGVYEFEYFVNRHEYWHGTYEIFINRGGPGGPHGEPGPDGMDTYLMLLCDPQGPYEHRKEYKKAPEKESDTVVIEKDEGKYKYRLVMQRTTVDQRTPESTIVPYE